MLILHISSTIYINKANIIKKVKIIKPINPKNNNRQEKYYVNKTEFH
jgi:hypothetical protein